MNEGSREVVILPCHLRGAKVVPSRLHVDAHDVAEMTPSAARSLAKALLAAADDCERVDAKALPALDTYRAAIEEELSPAALLGVDDEVLGVRDAAPQRQVPEEARHPAPQGRPP